MAILTAIHHLLGLQLSALAFSAALPPPQPPSFPSNPAWTPKPSFNLTLPRPSKCVRASPSSETSAKSHANTLPSDLPAEDYYYRVPTTTVTVRFYHYGDNLRDAIAVQEVLAAAFKDAASHSPDLGIGTAKLQYSEKYVNTVDLVLLPEPTMNWQMWRFAVLGLGAFMQLWDNVWLSFDVEVDEVRGRVGTGYVFKNYMRVRGS
ncbi:MAG: hypothetical protein Q9161_004901 [Pseudevernia consocians]